MGLPEEVVNDVYHLTSVDIDQQHIVIIPNPLVRSVSWREPVAVRIVDEEPRLEEQAVQEEPDLQPVIPVRAVRRVVRSRVVNEAIVTAVINPVVIAFAAPTVVPATEIAPIPAVAAAVAPAPVVPAPAAPVAPEIVTSVANPIGTAGVAGDVADLIAETAAATVIAPFAPAITAVLDPVAAEIAPPLDLVGPAITAIFYAVGTDIPAPFDPARFDFTATVDPVSGKITTAPIELFAAEIAATLDLPGLRFAAPVDLASLNFAATIHTVGADFTATVDLLRALGGSRTGRHFAAKTARRCGAAGRGLRRRCLSRLRGRAVNPRLTPATAAFGADLLAFGAGFGAGLATIAAPVLRFGGGGGKNERERCGQGRQRSASGKKVHHGHLLQYRRPTTSGALRSRNYAPQTVAGMNRLADIQKNRR
jgi:hypothetical protein